MDLTISNLEDRIIKTRSKNKEIELLDPKREGIIIRLVELTNICEEGIIINPIDVALNNTKKR